MEGILTEIIITPGVFLSAVALLAFAFGGILLGYLSDLEKAGKRFFWTESTVPGPELRTFLPKEVEMRRAA
ncbi:MAG: hypothetical protein ACHQPI_00820 [Thermoanaerobaculia bacterium]